MEVPKKMIVDSDNLSKVISPFVGQADPFLILHKIP